MKALKEKFAWLFSGHYKMERFGIMFLVLAVLLGCTVGSIYGRKVKLEHVQLGSQVLYTSSCQMSLTGNTCKVEHVFLNSDQTKAFVLIKWDDMAGVVTDASKYKMFVTGSNPSMGIEKLQSNPSGGIYMFGTSGYMGLYLVDVSGFAEQIMYVIVRCDEMAKDVALDREPHWDESFNQHDQFCFWFNPGASGFVPDSFLDEGRMDIYDIYEATVVNGREEAIRNSLDDCLASMQGCLKRMEEYGYRVERDGIVLLDRPVQIRTDEITSDEEGNLSLSTQYVLQGGYDFDWRNGSILEGYLDDVVPENYTAPVYLTTQAKAVSKESWDVSRLTWYRTDGSAWTGENPYGDGSITQTNSDINNLVGIWTEYFNLKQQYQTQLLPQLLQLELNIRTVITNYTMNVSDDACTVW